MRGVVAMVVIGVALGGLYNWRGQAGKPPWGLPWIGEDKLAATPSLEELGAGNGEPVHNSSADPMAITGGTDGLPQIPDLDRPIEVGIAAVKQLFDAKAAVVVDAREPDEYAEGHIPGALSMPYDEVTGDPARIESLETGGKPIIVYCGGGACELSLSLAYDMIYAGHKKVLVYMGGFSEWAEVGNAVATGPEPGA